MLASAGKACVVRFGAETLITMIMLVSLLTLQSVSSKAADIAEPDTAVRSPVSEGWTLGITRHRADG
jgi:hypothetical protein